MVPGCEIERGGQHGPQQVEHGAAEGAIERDGGGGRPLFLLLFLSYLCETVEGQSHEKFEMYTSKRKKNKKTERNLTESLEMAK